MEETADEVPLAAPISVERPHGAEAHSESTRAVIAAMAANFAIASGKFVGGALTGSAAMLAEGAHSVADTFNQVFLLIGINLSGNDADETHPYGYGKERFFWAFLVAVCLFVAGAAFSFYEGGRTLIQGDEHERHAFDLGVAFSVLGVAFVFESASLTFAVRAARQTLHRTGWTFRKFLRESPDVVTKTVLFEDSAALVGLAIAGGGLALSVTLGNEMWDGIASLCIGAVLASVSVVLGMESRHLLLGAAASEEVRASIRHIAGSFPEVERVVRLLTMQLGTDSILVTGELQLRAGLTTTQIESLISRIDDTLEREMPEVHNTFWELRRRGGD